MLFVKTILFTIIMPGTVTVWTPYLLNTNIDLASVNLGVFKWVGVLCMLVGAGIYCICALDFVTKGKGTPAPIDAPKFLVKSRLYRYSRNTMYVGFFILLVGEALYFGRVVQYLYLACFVASVVSFVHFYEEPHLRKTFGESYIEYYVNVRRWF